MTKAPKPDRPVGRDQALPRVAEAELLMSAPRVDRLASSVPFEVAVVGRSNVGKSSFINRVCNKRHLARTSSTPGRTQQVVLFSIALLRPPSPPAQGLSHVSPVQVTLADLPGFGYAKLSKGQHRSIGALIDSYLEHRGEAQLVCLLNDARRNPEHEELSVQAYATEYDLPHMVVVTKADKLTRTELAKRLKAIAQAYHLEPADLVVTGDKIPVQPFWERVLLLLDAQEKAAR